MFPIPLKQTKPVDWASPLRTYLNGISGNASEFKQEIAAFDAMRTDILDPPKGANGRDLLYRYYGQLELLDLRVPLNERGCRVQFAWQNLYGNEEIVQTASAFEKANVLFNLAAVNSHIGHDADPKLGFAAFQAAAGIFKFLSESFLHAPSLDFAPETAKTLSVYMLARAQQAFFEKASAGPAKPGLLSKIAEGAARLYTKASEGFTEQYNDNNWGERAWGQATADAGKYMKGVAHYYYARHLDGTKKYGEAIAQMGEAKKIFGELKAVDKSSDSKDMHERASQELSIMDKDNDFIYHEPVPPVVAEVPSLDAAEPTPMDKLYAEPALASRVVGKDLFSKVIPLDVHEKASLYSEKKAQLARDKQEAVDMADQELRSALDYMDLPRSARLLRHPEENDDISGVPAAVKEWGQEVAANPLKLDLEGRRQDVLNTLQSPFARPEANYEVQKLKQALISAADNDKRLAANYDLVKEDIATLKSPYLLEQQFTFKPTAKVSLLDLDDTEDDSVRADLDKLLTSVTKLQKIERERKAALAELKEKLHADDISDQLVLNRKNPDIEQTLFRNELAKFAPYVTRIDATTRLQNQLLATVSELWQRVLAAPSIKRKAADRENVISQRTAAIDRFRQAYDMWLSVATSLQQAHEFYDKLQQSARAATAPADLGFDSLSLSSAQRQPQQHSAAPSLPPKPSDFSGYSVPSAYNSSLYQPPN